MKTEPADACSFCATPISGDNDPMETGFCSEECAKRWIARNEKELESLARRDPFWGTRPHPGIDSKPRG